MIVFGLPASVFQAEDIRAQLADSLARLGTDYIDLYYQVRSGCAPGLHCFRVVVHLPAMAGQRTRDYRDGRVRLMTLLSSYC